MQKELLRMRLQSCWHCVWSLTLLTACGGGSTAGSDSAVGDASMAVPPVSRREAITWRLQSSYCPEFPAGRYGHQPEGGSWRRATNGRLQVELYEPGALCQTSDILTYLSQNAFDCAVIFGSTLLRPDSGGGSRHCGIPFAWESSAEIYDVMENYGLAGCDPGGLRRTESSNTTGMPMSPTTTSWQTSR